MTIRRATVDDSAQIAELCGELGYPASAEEIAERVRQITPLANDFTAVAEIEAGRIAGWIQVNACWVIESGFRAAIVGLVVSTAHRRLGIGKNLVLAAEAWATAIGARVLVVRSNAARKESHAFYPALGFAETKTQQVYRKALG